MEENAKTITELFDEIMDTISGMPCETVLRAVTEESGENYDEMTPDDYQIGMKLSSLAARIGAYVIDNFERFPELAPIFGEELMELETLCNQHNESEEEKQD